MLWLALGGLTLFLLIAGLRAFERAPVATIKSLLTWMVALGGILLALLLVLTGRGAMAVGALVMFGPLMWNRWRASRLASGARTAGSSGGSAPPRSRSGSMTRQEAYEVLGLQAGATEDEIRAAHRRLMRTAHPDSGGSDWLAARVNMARDVLLGGRHA